MTDRTPLAQLTKAALDQLYDDLDDLRRQLAESRAAEAILGRRVVGWAELAKSHQHWGQRRWNAWKSARRRAQQLRADAAELEQKADGWREQAFRNSQALAAADAANDRVRGYAHHLSDNGDDRGSFILTLLDTDPMRTTAQAAGQPEPATITGPTVAECAEADARWPLEKHGE
jgi:hypothetical protein